MVITTYCLCWVSNIFLLALQMGTLRHGKFLNTTEKRHNRPEQNKIEQSWSNGQMSAAEVFLTMILNNETHFPFTVNMEMEACARKTFLSFKILYNRVCTNMFKFSLINFNLFPASSLYKRTGTLVRALPGDLQT